MRDVIRQKLADSVRSELPVMTRRDLCPPAVPGKTHAVIGIRRAGKTCFLHQLQRERVENGAPRETQVYFNFDDERLAGMEAAQLHWVLEEYFQQFPQYRDQRKVGFFSRRSAGHPRVGRFRSPGDGLGKDGPVRERFVGEAA